MIPPKDTPTQITGELGKLENKIVNVLPEACQGLLGRASGDAFRIEHTARVDPVQNFIRNKTQRSHF